MKDITHHRNKTQRKVLKTPSPEDDNYNWAQNYSKKPGLEEQKKLRKEHAKKMQASHVNPYLTPDEQNNKKERRKTPSLRHRSYH